MRAAPIRMKTARMIMAPRIPQRRTGRWYIEGTPNVLKIRMKTNRLSTERAYSMTYPVRYSTAGCRPKRHAIPAPKRSARPTHPAVHADASRIDMSCGFLRTAMISTNIRTSTKTTKPPQIAGVPIDTGNPYASRKVVWKEYDDTAPPPIPEGALSPEMIEQDLHADGDEDEAAD